MRERQRLHISWTEQTSHLILTIVSVLCVIPIIMIVSASFTSEASLARNGFSLIPVDFSTAAYDYIFRDPSQIIQSYGVSLFVTISGSAVSLLLSALLAYALSRPEFQFRRSIAFFVFFTMLFNGGLVPWYILISRYLQLKNSLLVLVLPYLIIPWYVLLLRTFFAQLPQELVDAARIDGAGEWRIFFSIAMPLSLPALATVGLFIMLMYWNDWWLALLFIDERTKAPIQYLLYVTSTNIDFITSSPQVIGIQVPVVSVRMAMAAITIVPISVAYLFVQKYLVRGIIVGSFK